MIVFQIVIPLLFCTPMAIYLFFYVRGIVTFIKKEENKKQSNLITFLIVTIIILNCVSIFSTRTMIVIHFIVITVLLKVINKFVTNKQWDFLYRTGILAIIICIGYMGYGYYNMKDVINTKYYYQTNKSIDHLKIAFVADLHFGTTMNDEDLEEYCDDISKQNVDLVILGGDIIDESTTKEQMQQCARLLGNISSSYGTYYIYGNHDSFQKSYFINTSFDKKDLETAFDKNTITILQDDSILINDEFYLVGRDDASFNKTSGRKPLNELLSTLDMNKYIILLDHQPIELQNVSKASVDLMLSGHTHGGQIWPLGQINKMMRSNELEYGQQTINQLHAIVTSGIGGWSHPIRTISRSEIVYIEIR